jgi:prepilin-type N-terminal cleavage/methylation domain-containing protein
VATCARAFSLIEVLVVIALLSLIIIGLVAMFSQTQRAYKLGMTQVDVLEGGRAVTDMLTRELSQMTASRASNGMNFYARLRAYTPLYQALPGNPGRGRTNLLEETFFLTHENQRWYGVGYFVRTNLRGSSTLGFPQEGLGTLYRFETNYSEAQFRANPNSPVRDYNVAQRDDRTATKLIDGVVHFKLRAYDTNSVWINRSIAPSITNIWSLTVPDEIGTCYYVSNAVPASVEIELGILEERAAERARSITSPTARYNYLTNEAGKVHVFRWRVPIRNVDPTAYQ